MLIRSRIPLLTALLITSLALAGLAGLAGNTTVKGRLMDADSGGPAAGVTIQVCAADGCSGSAGQSDANGYYTITGAPSGSVWTLVTFPTGSCSSGEYARAHAGIGLPGSGTVNAPVIVLTKQKGSIGGKVRDGSGNPIAGAQVQAENSEQGGDGFNYARTGGDGSYLIPCLPAGRGYFVTASGPRGGPYGQQVDSMFTVASGQVVGHDITLTSASSAIAGRVTCGGQGCAGVNVLVQRNCDGSSGARQGCAVSSLQTGQDGSFQAGNLVGGSYVIHAFAPPGFDSTALFDVQVAEGQTTNSVRLDLVPNGPGSSGRLTGAVTSESGAPMPECRLNIFDTVPPGPPMGQGMALGIHTDGSGNYDTGWTLNPGSHYRVYLDCPGRAEISTDTDVSGRAILLSAGRTGIVNLSFGGGAGATPGGASPSADPSGSPSASPGAPTDPAVASQARTLRGRPGGFAQVGLVRRAWSSNPLLVGSLALAALLVVGGLALVSVRRFRRQRRALSKLG